MSENTAPVSDEDARGQELTDKIIELCDAEESNVNALAALMCALTNLLARFCPDCRRNLGRHLKKSIPRLLRDAAELAAERREDCTQH